MSDQVLDEDARRFASLDRLYGAAGLSRLRAARVVVVGIGGVGSWAAEALARSGIGALDLIDLDHVAESNINRQVHALGSTLGAAKVEAMRERIADIAPQCRVQAIDAFVETDSAGQLIDAAADVVIDATDQVRAKAAMAALARQRGQGLIVCGAAGGRTDPLALREEDVALIKGDALIANLRARLRREYGFAREPGRRFGLRAVYSIEPPGGRGGLAAGQGGDGAQGMSAGAGAPLACAGYGSIVTVTAAMGLAAASLAMRMILHPAKSA